MNRRGGERELIGGTADAMVVEWACEAEISFKIPILDNEILMMLQDLGKETDPIILPAVSPIWYSPIYLYILSPALLPLFILLKARYLNCLRTVS